MSDPTEREHGVDLPQQPSSPLQRTPTTHRLITILLQDRMRAVEDAQRDYYRALEDLRELLGRVTHD
jgi:hypothetical protein